MCLLSCFLLFVLLVACVVVALDFAVFLVGFLDLVFDARITTNEMHLEVPYHPRHPWNRNQLPNQLMNPYLTL